MPTPFPTSYWFVRVPKTASSTLSGILRAVAAHYGVHPVVYSHHNEVEEIKYQQNVRFLAIVEHAEYDPKIFASLQPAKLFTALRDPLHRLLSNFNWDYLDGKVRARDVDSYPNIRKCLNSSNSSVPSKQQIIRCWKNSEEEVLSYANSVAEYQLRYIGWSRGALKEGTTVEMQKSYIRHLLDSFDFLFITERFDESIVAFMMLFGLEYRDVVYLPSKGHVAKRHPEPRNLPTRLREAIEKNEYLTVYGYNYGVGLLDGKIASLDSKCAPSFGSLFDAFLELQSALTLACTGANAASFYKQYPYLESSNMNRHEDGGRNFRCLEYLTPQLAKAK